MGIRHNQPHTSNDAYRMIIPAKWILRRQVRHYAKEMGERGFTDWEMCEHFMNHTSSYRTRRCELVELGEIVPTEFRRPTPANRMAVVWKIREGATSPDRIARENDHEPDSQ